MKLDVLAPFAFLTYYRYSFFCVDFILFGLFLYSFYNLTYLYILPQKNSHRFKLLRKFVTIALAVLFVSYILLSFTILFRSKPVFVHAATDLGLSGYLFVLFVMIRFITTILIGSLLASTWFVLETDEKTVMVKRWYSIVVALFIVFVFNLLYMFSPSLNKALPLYEWFYNVRNLFIIRAPNRVQKTRLCIDQLENIDGYDQTLFEDEWERTFLNYAPSRDRIYTTPSD